MYDVPNSSEQSAGGRSQCKPDGSHGSESGLYKDQENNTRACCCLLIGPSGREAGEGITIPLTETSPDSLPGCGQGARRVRSHSETQVISAADWEEIACSAQNVSPSSFQHIKGLSCIVCYSGGPSRFGPAQHPLM